MIPTTTVAAPMMAAPMTATMPLGTTMVAQSPSYVAAPPQMITQTPSYVAPPVMQYAPTMPAVMAPPPTVPVVAPPPMALPASIPVPQPPGAPPPRLTQGIPDPAQIEKQKLAYAAALDKQLQDAMATVQNETRIEKEMVAFKTQKDIALFETQVDEKLVEQLAAEDERAAFANSQLKKALVDRNIQLNAQAASLVMDYNMKMAMDDIAKKKAEFERNFITAENKLAQDYMKAAMAPMYAAPAAAVPKAAPKPTR